MPKTLNPKVYYCLKLPKQAMTVSSVGLNKPQLRRVGPRMPTLHRGCTASTWIETSHSTLHRLQITQQRLRLV